MEFNGTFLATIITFIIFVFVMNKILYEPILGIMEKRKNFIDENYKLASENNSKTEELSEEIQSKLVDAKDDARGKYIEAIDGFKAQKAEVLEDAQKTANEDMERSREELKHVSDEVKDALKGSMDELAGDIVEKIIGYRSDIHGFDNDKVSAVLWGDK